MRWRSQFHSLSQKLAALLKHMPSPPNKSGGTANFEGISTALPITPLSGGIDLPIVHHLCFRPVGLDVHAGRVRKTSTEVSAKVMDLIFARVHRIQKLAGKA